MTRIIPPEKDIYDEMIIQQDDYRDRYTIFHQWLSGQTKKSLDYKRKQADTLFHRVGITFTVYGEEDDTERLIPFDIIPRIISAKEWLTLHAGLKQRLDALNQFICDIYHEQKIIKKGIISAQEIFANDCFEPCMLGLDLPDNIYSQISGIDIIRNNDGDFYVLEDNLRTPSGVSYMLENRKMMMRLFPELFAMQGVEPVEHYPSLLLKTLQESTYVKNPCIALLTPGRFNSAYFEHAFLAQQMGVELVEGRDLIVKDNHLYMRTTDGHRQVDVLYRRINDDYLDPLAFVPNSILGVPGLLSVYKAGNVVITNAIGTGIADDKAIYPYVPDMIRFYLGEEPLLKNVQTWMCRKQEDLNFVLANLKDLVVKEVHGAGGYGMLIGPCSTKKEIEEFSHKIKDDPSNYIAQPTLSLSTCPTFVENGVAPRHIDLRPFLLYGKSIRIIPGGLTRVALKEGSLVVNSSQGGGTKDTWVLEEES